MFKPIGFLLLVSLVLFAEGGFYNYFWGLSEETNGFMNITNYGGFRDGCWIHGHHIGCLYYDDCLSRMPDCFSDNGVE